MSVRTVQDLMRAGARRLEENGMTAAQATAAARVLLMDAIGITREALLIHPEQPVTTEDIQRYEAHLSRRERREPMAYVLGWREFYGRPFRVTPDVLIPRQETEHVVETALDALKGKDSSLIADIGTGSGAIAVSLALNLPGATVLATDISPNALALAKENARENGAADRVSFFEGDLLAPIANRAPFDAVVSNPPYIAPEEIETLEPEVKDWEPRVALGINPDALHFYRRFATEAPALLAPGGILVVEVGMGQAEDVADLWRSAGLQDVTTFQDYAGIKRVVFGKRPQ